MADDVALGEVAQITMGQSPPGSTYNSDGEGLPFFQGVADFGTRHPTPRVYCSAPTRVASPGDILLSVRAPIGRVNIANTTCATGRGLAILRPRDPTDARYIEFVLRSLERSWSRLEGGGSVFGNATKKDLETLAIPWPEPMERQAVGEVLGALDDKIELNRRMAQTLEEMARALFKSWFVDFDPVRAKAEGRDPGLPKHLADLFPDRLVNSELGEIPDGWSVKPIGDLADVVGGSTPSTREPAYWDGSYGWATPKDLSTLAFPVLLGTERRITDAGLRRISSGLLPMGTVLLSSRAPIGYLAIAEIPVAINQGFIAMKPKGGVSNLFLLWWARAAHDVILSNANGSTFLEISKKHFRPIRVVAPPADVMASFDRVVRPFYEQLASSQRETQALVALRDSLLTKLVEGELRLPDPEGLLARLEAVG